MNLRSKPSSAEPVNILKDPTRAQFLTSSRCNPHPTRPTSLRSRKRGLRTSHRNLKLPFIDSDGVLIIPFGAHERYNWWADGQTAQETVEEIRHRQQAEQNGYEY